MLAPGRRERTVFPLWLRITHWLNAIGVILMVMSGWRIYNASPFFPFRIPNDITIGGWLGGALQWHLTFAWLFLTAGIAYGAYQVSTRNYRQVLFSSADVRGVWPMVRHYFFFGPRPSLTETYNPLQKLAYTSALGFGVVLAATGLALYKPVQLSGLVWVFGGLRLTRIWHFAAMTGLLGFIPGHLIMVALHGWSNFASMWTGFAEARD